MDFLLIVIALGGFVTAIVMLVLASRANRLQNESDERVETLEAMATGSVLFATSAPIVQSPQPEEDDVDLALNEFADEDQLCAGDSVGTEEPRVLTPAAIAVTASAYPFVMTVPAAAGTGRVQVSFDRSRTRSRP